MLYIKLAVACAAMLLSWLCFSEETPVQENVSVITEEKVVCTEVLTEEIADSMMEAVGCGILYTPMAGRHLETLPLLPSEAQAAEEEEASADRESVMEADVCYVHDDNAVAMHETYLKNCEMQEDIAARERLAEQKRIAEQKRRAREEKEAQQRRIAEEKAAKEAALRAACPGYDRDFIAMLTKEEQAEAQYFYEQGFVFYRQNWSVLDNAEYGNEGFGQCGCGPTCIAAIISNLAGIPVDPEEMRVYGLSVGSWLPSGGTTYGFLIETAKKYGITCTQIYASDKEALYDALRDENKLVLATMGPGDFTLGAHFMLFRGITDEGKILISDSYSFEHSVKEWDYDALYAQLKTGYWIFEKTE